MTNKTFLILLLAGVSYTAYNATAVSENFEISTTIDHEITLGNFKAASADANLDVSENLNLGVIIIDPDCNDYTWWSYFDDGAINLENSNLIISASPLTGGFFHADIPNPSDCTNRQTSCGGLSVLGDSDVNANIHIFDTTDGSHCTGYIKYTGNENIFRIYPNCAINNPSLVPLGTHTSYFTISYTPS
ncbi:MAG: hypothetical protein IJ689_06820 [Alphaproteobacteria bacterium]|nr:hypothetical protein [Alphaproteobacteria bacterium]